MKKIILLTLLCFLFSNHKAQSFYTVYTPTILSQNASDVKVITKVHFINSATLINHSVSVDNVNKKVNLISCYNYQPLLPMSPTLVSTVTIGALATGNYDLNYTVFISSSFTTCTPYDTTASTYTFYAGPTSIQELSNDNKFKVSPNPVKDYFKIATADNSSLIKVEIINILGDKVLEINEPTSNDYIDISSLAKGFYLVNIYTDKSSFIKKIIKE